MKKVAAFTPAQLDAIDVSKRRMDACVVAGPGSGKTTVLVEYFSRLVAEHVDPLRILAITFTEKAAANMRDKLAEAFRGDLAVRARLERAWVSTVHGFCARLLRENAVYAGIDPEFYVADERESWQLRQEAMADAMDGLLAEHPAAMRALIRGLSSFEFEEALLSAYDAMRGAGTTVEELACRPAPAGITLQDVARILRDLASEPLTSWSYSQREHLAAILESGTRIVTAAGPKEALAAIEEFPANLRKCKNGTAAYNLVSALKTLVKDVPYSLITEFYTAERGTLLEILRRFDRIYRERKRRAGALDFADLEEFAVRLLETDGSAQARIRDQFDHVLMDEFQDTNGQQARLMNLVRPPDRFYAVGDRNQSIFGFRHAAPEVFDDYKKDVERRGRHLVQLTDNFRSRAEVLRAVETIVHKLPGVEERRLLPRREFPQARPVSVEVLSASDAQVEARWVARRVVELLGEGFAFGDVAVLVRNTEVIAGFTAAFDEARVPYLVNRGKGFYESREVNDLTHLLRVIANPRDEISLAAVLRSPLVAVADEALLSLKIAGENLGQRLMRLKPEQAGDFDPEDYRRLCRFRDRLREWRIGREYVSFDRLLLSAMDDCGYPMEPGTRAAANIDKFLAQAREAAARLSLDAFVNELALIRASNPREPDAPPDDSADAVKIMTVHSAKGLEFPVVFVAALHKGVESNPPAVAFSRTRGLGARWRNPAAREEKDDLVQHELRNEWRQREDAEARRLLYVAMTRAEQHLALTFSGNKPGNWARDVIGRLDLHPREPGEEIRSYRSPYGEEWKLRVVTADRAPELLRAPVANRPAAPNGLELAPLAVPGPPDGNATVTALARFASCPREYFLSHYLGFEGRLRKAEDANGEVPAGEFGTQVHDLLAAKAVADPDPEAKRLAEVFAQSALGRRVQRAARVEREFDFLMAVEDLVIRGQIDLWFDEGGELVIVDYKTDAVNAAGAHARAEEYALQLRLYAMAVDRVAGRPADRACLYFLRPNICVEVDLTPSLLESPEQVLRDFRESQEKMVFPLVESERCVRCAFYRDLCPSAFRPQAGG